MIAQTTVTCDNCGETEIARGLVDWLHVELHPETVSTHRLNRVPFTEADLCGWTCLAAYGKTQADAR